MDSIVITAAVILAVIALIEIVTLLCASPGRSAPAYLAVLPVFSGDEEFPARLERLAERPCGRTSVILVDYSADSFQRGLISRFLSNNPDAAFISQSELEKIFAERFAIR